MHELRTTGLIFSDFKSKNTEISLWSTDSHYALYIASRTATIRLLKKQHNELVMTDVQYH